MHTADRDPGAYLPISTVEKFAFCKRQAYLQYAERADAENRFIVEGSLLHGKVAAGGEEKRGGLTIARGVHLVSHELGVRGIADVLETHGDAHEDVHEDVHEDAHRSGADDPGAVPTPVEYKRGKGRRRFSQHVQLCLQAMCVEEMLGVVIPAAAIYHAGSRRRERVVLDDAIRETCRALVAEARAALNAPGAPAPVPMAACRSCSVRAHCLPALADRAPAGTLHQYLRRHGWPHQESSGR